MRNSKHSTGSSPDIDIKNEFTNSSPGSSHKEDVLYTNGKPRISFPNIEILISPPSEKSSDSELDGDGDIDVLASGLGMFPIFTQGSLEESSSCESSDEEKQYESPSMSSADDSEFSADEEILVEDDLSFIFIDKAHASSADDDLNRHATSL